MSTVCHIGAFNGRNAGDAAIQVAMHQMFPADWNWWTIDCQGRLFDRELIAEINDRADIVIVGGGGLFWDRPGDNSVSGWQWSIRTEDIAKIRPPLVVYAVGWTAFPYRDRTAQHPEIRRSIMALLDRADAFSVRNRGTFWKMMDLCLGSAACVVPDPAYFIRSALGNEYPPNDLGDGHRKYWRVALCRADDRPVMRFRMGVTEADRFRRRVETIFPAPGVTQWHVDHCDFEPGHPCALALEYSRMDLVLGMRKHSLIIPIGQGVPVIGLGDMDEVRWILEDVGLGEWLITSRSTAAQADELVRRAAAGEQPAVDLAGMRAVTDAFNARVVALAERTVVV